MSDQFTTNSGKDVSPGNIERLAGKHIRLYQSRVSAGVNGDQSVRLQECLYYLNVWRNIRGKEYNWAKLDQNERREILDAIESGE